VRENFARIAFARSSDAPPDNSVQFYDGYFAQLPAKTYTIEATHTLEKPPAQVPTYSRTQTFTVRAPEFTIDPTTVMQAYPAGGSSDIYDQQLPFLTLADPGLPWERSLVPGSDAPPDHPMPWLALVLFAEGEVYLQSATNSPVATAKVSDLLEVDAGSTVLKPALPAGWVSPELMASQCQIVTIPGATFNAVMPLKTDLPCLAHCRAVNAPHEDQLLHAVLIANRLPVADTTTKPPAPRRYFAHLVSLEGFADYLGPNPKPIPTRPGSSALMDVQLVSLYNWTFVSMPESFASFKTTLEQLIASEASTGGALRLPATPAPNLPPAAAQRLQDGYVALKFVAGSGDDTFAWYRGPLTPVVPRPLPQVGRPPVAISHATSAEALMIYLAEQGVFDMSYAAAWNIGRNLALADAHFAEAINRYVRAARTAAATVAQRLALPHFEGEQDPGALLARDASRRRFADRVGNGLGRDWTEALDRVRRSQRPSPDAASRSNGRGRHAAAAAAARHTHARALWARPEIAAAIREHVGEQADPVAEWLANLSLLYPVPFSHLVPDPRVLPVESIRFFYVDPDWIDALKAGACSIALHDSGDVTAFRALHPHLTTAVTMTGMLMRSSLVASCPALVVAATAKGTPLKLARNDCPSANVRLCLFAGIPDIVTLAQPYQGLLFGVDDDGVVPRRVSGSAQQIGQAIAGTSVPPQGGYQAFLKRYCRSETGGVIDVGNLSTDLAAAVGANGRLGGGNFAMQMVRVPEQQSFSSR
jgi:hypothetical protein